MLMATFVSLCYYFLYKQSQKMTPRYPSSRLDNTTSRLNLSYRTSRHFPARLNAVDLPAYASTCRQR